MANVKTMDHPLIRHKISLLRDSSTSSKEFRELVSEIAMLMCYEATRDLPLKEVSEQVGYYNVSSFTRRFKLNQGVTPGEYRKSASAAKKS